MYVGDEGNVENDFKNLPEKERSVHALHFTDNISGGAGVVWPVSFKLMVGFEDVFWWLPSNNRLPRQA